MRPEENQYKMIVESAPSMICRTGTDGLCDYFNKTWLDFTGRTVDQEFGKGWIRGVHPDDIPSFEETSSNAFAERRPFEVCYRLRRHDGEWRYISARAVPYFDEEHVFMGYIANSRDITGQVTGEQDRIMAQIDGLTGVLSRQHFIRRATEEYERAERFRQNLCLAMIDIDNFKAVNDMYGLQVGDEVLRLFARSLASNVRKFDLVGRFGGDKFIILFANTDLIQATFAIKRLAQMLEAPMSLPGGISLAVTFSHGFSVLQQDATLETVIRIAEDTLNRVKGSQGIKP